MRRAHPRSWCRRSSQRSFPTFPTFRARRRRRRSREQGSLLRRDMTPRRCEQGCEAFAPPHRHQRSTALAGRACVSGAWICAWRDSSPCSGMVARSRLVRGWLPVLYRSVKQNAHAHARADCRVLVQLCNGFFSLHIGVIVGVTKDGLDRGIPLTRRFRGDPRGHAFASVSCAWLGRAATRS